MTPNCQETSKTVQLYLCEVSPNKYVWNPPYYRETKFILLKNIAKRRLPTPLRISGKVKNRLAAKQKVVRSIRGPQGPSRRRTVCFWNPVPEKRSTPLAKEKMIAYPPQWRVISKTNYFSAAGALRGPEVPYNFLLCRQPFFLFFKFLKE